MSEVQILYNVIPLCQRTNKNLNKKKFLTSNSDTYFRLVNGNPVTQHKNAFLHQFSSDEQDLLQVYLGLFLMYCILTPIQLHATQKQKHPISKLLAIGLCVQFLALALICLHYGLFAANGQGIRILSVIGTLRPISV